MKKGVSSLLDLKDGLQAFGLGIGNVYYVVQAANTAIYTYLMRRQKRYQDGSAMVYTTIQAALDVTVDCRNDYVVVMPDASDYDLTVALTLSKKAVHLICPAGLTGGSIGSTNGARVHQNGAFEVMTISAPSVEVAGFFFKGAADQSIIEISVGSHNVNIHDNFVGMTTTSGSASAYGIHGTGESQGLFIHHNYVTVYQPTASVTVGGGIVLDNGTRSQISNNIVATGGFAQTMSKGISPGSGALSIVADNILNESDSGTPASSVFTKGIILNAGSIAVRNVFAMTTKANCLNGGAANMAAIENFDSTTGGELRTLDA
jgi:hypothetical protein